MHRPRSLIVASAVLLLGAIALPAQATHDPVQTLPGNGHASEVYVGIADDGTATAVWDDAGAVKVATRPAGGFFGVPQTLEAGVAENISLDESPNGNAVVAWSGGMSEGSLLASTRIGGGTFGAPQVLVGSGGNVPADLDVAISDAGRAVVVWQEDPSGSDSMIRAALSDSSGDLGPAATIHQAPNLQGPKVDMNGLGEALAVWESLSLGSIQTAAAPAGGPFGSMTVLRTLGQGTGLPELGVSPSGIAVVAWKNATTPDPQCDTIRDCTPVPVLEAVYGNVAGSFGSPQSVTDPSQPTVSGGHEVAVDDSGRAAIIFTATISNTSGLFGAISDAFGSFTSGAVTISASPTSDTHNFEIDAGGGDFTAVWANDHDQDGVGEAWQATSSGGSFGSPHQTSPEDDSSASMVHGARNGNGQTIAGWVLDIDGLVAQVTPVAQGEPPSYGSDSDDDLIGTPGDDVVHLLGGDDTYSGGDGNDSIFGEEGNDTLKGDGGSDLVDGGPGSDTANGGAGDDSLLGRGGSDRLKGGTGDDTLKGGGGNDVLDGGGFGAATSASGAALTHGGEVIVGGAGKDTCFKYSKQDVLKSCEIVKRKRAH